MQEALQALNGRLADATAENEAPITIKAGVGLNTGNCIVGNMGSEQRFDYSVLGDAVNLASRLEGQSKTYGVDILIGEDTRAAAPEFATLELDMLAVKGRAAAVHVFALLGDSTLREGEAFTNLEQAQADLLTSYRAQQWDTARQHARRCRDLSHAEWNLDTLYDLYEERITTYELTPPGAGWTGVYVAETK
jgi:adenylate cyclase